MPGKHVHFASDAFPDTPSPTFSSSSLPSSGGPRTPLSAAGSSLTGYLLARIHPVLGINQPSPMLEYDVSYPPSTIKPNVSTIPPHVLHEPATTPPVPSMVIRCPHLPWTITILPTSTKHVTVRDVLDGIHRSLRLAALEAEFQCLPSPEAKHSVNNAYIRRYKRIDMSEVRELEKNKGLKRVDFLGERTKFTGLSSTMEGPHVWLLSMS
ncbi:hypothetical protein BYT27DRAFT_7181317 [Phlegmacium glaucopus]|nr:hypothetical protein BYT27DRAFT_7181317 [Phlegmacium glaucopus]